MGCDLEGFVVKCDQQCTEDEQPGKDGVGIVVSKSEATVRKASAAARPTRFCCRRTAQLVVVPMACTKLVVERSLHARSLDCAAAGRCWQLAGRWQMYLSVVQRACPYKRLTESNSTPAMDFGCEEIRKRRYTQTKNRTKQTNTTVI